MHVINKSTCEDASLQRFEELGCLDEIAQKEMNL